MSRRPASADVRRATAAAARATRDWRRMPALERGRLLHEAAGALRANRAEISKLLTLEGGKPRIENLDEVEWSAACFQYYAEIGRHSHGSSIPPTAEHQLNFTIKEPLGVVAAIVPFNYPLLLLTWKIAPALAAGNTVVIKPSELTPLATLRMVEHALVALSAWRGQCRDRRGRSRRRAGRRSGCRVHRLHRVRRPSGSGLRSGPLERLKRVNLELGGIDPLIVFEDADLDVAVPGAAWARFLNNGQVCTSAKRIYVVEPIAQAFIDRFVAHTRSLRVGNGMDPDIDLGPLISERARHARREPGRAARSPKARGCSRAAAASTSAPAGSTRRPCSPTSPPHTR